MDSMNLMHSYLSGFHVYLCKPGEPYKFMLRKDPLKEKKLTFSYIDQV
jgi:hypothetical protein